MLTFCHSPEAFFDLLKNVLLLFCRYQVLLNEFFRHHQVQCQMQVYKVLNHMPGSPHRSPKNDNILKDTSRSPIIILIINNKTINSFQLSHSLGGLTEELNGTMNKFNDIINFWGLFV